MGPEASGGRRGRVAVIVAPVATLIACLVLFFNLVRFLAHRSPCGLRPVASSCLTKRWLMLRPRRARCSVLLPHWRATSSPSLALPRTAHLHAPPANNSRDDVSTR